MINIVKSKLPNTLIAELAGNITSAELDVINTGLFNLEQKNKEVNLVVSITDVNSQSFGALIRELEYGIIHWNKLNKVAYVGDKKWWKSLVELDDVFTKFKEKYFDINKMESAIEWIKNEMNA